MQSGFSSLIRANLTFSPENLTLQDAVFLLLLAYHADTDDPGYLKPYYPYAMPWRPCLNTGGKFFRIDRTIWSKIESMILLLIVQKGPLIKSIS